MRRTTTGFAALMCFAAVSVVSAQTANVGAGKVEVGGFPIGGTFLVGGDDDKEVDFNVYSAGANLTYYLSERFAVEGELGISFGLAQDVLFRKQEVLHVQLPNVWSYFGNVVFFPSGTRGHRAIYYVTAGAGAVSLQSRQPTKPFGYDVDTVGFVTFLAENIGGGVKLFLADAPDWGVRVDYRYLIVDANDSAPAFFAQAKSRAGHRFAFGILHTWK